MTAEELEQNILDELPDIFSRNPGTLVDKIRSFVEFYSVQSTELMNCYSILPDYLNRTLKNRIEILKERADRESHIAVHLRKRLEEIQPGSSSDI